MPIMYCNFNMFDINAQVVYVDEGKESFALFTGTFEEVCEFMAEQYQSHKYQKIVLGGPYAEAVENRVRAYSRTNYNFNDINIEVIE